MEIHQTVVEALESISKELRAEIADDDGSAANHARSIAQIPALKAIEVHALDETSPSLVAPAKIVAWNIERGYNVDDIAAQLLSVSPDVVLLCEVDLGMARTGQRHIAREIAQRLGMGYAFAAEYAELDLGSERERQMFMGQQNDIGFHGAAIVSKSPPQRSALIRLETSGDWYGRERGERRIGGRMALIVELEISGEPVVFANVHLENRSTPIQRGKQMTDLLDGIETFAPNCPVLIGGDFNTNTAARDRPDWPEYQVILERETPGRFSNPHSYEPLFEIAEVRGYDWRSCNVEGTTTRLHPWHSTNTPLAKLDWFFSKGLEAADPAIHAAVSKSTGGIISDHDMLSVLIEKV